MLSITLIILLLAIPLSKTIISATMYTRMVTLALAFAALISYSSFPVVSTIDISHNLIDISISIGVSPLSAGLGLYSGLLHTTTITLTMIAFMQVSGALIILSIPLSYFTNKMVNGTLQNNAPIILIAEYPMIILFTIIGGTFLMASADLVSIYLSIELQSFGVYVLAAISRDSESATSAGLKYFLLGALSSALILLGSALVYGYTGLTNLDSIYELISVPDIFTYSSQIKGSSQMEINGLSYFGDTTVIYGFVIISVGLLFKVASAPFHYWAPDVYDGTPTIVTTWLTVIPKISILIFILELYVVNGYSTMANTIGGFITVPTYMILICAFLSIVIGTVVGLGQDRIKRLLAYSTISHVGFILLALGIASISATSTLIPSMGIESVIAFLFYIVQYTLTNIDAFLILLAFGYIAQSSENKDITYTEELMGQFRSYPVLSLCFALCLFSIAGVPPIAGFFAKYTILYSAVHSGYLFLAVSAILASVVSAVYYLWIIRVIHFSPIPILEKSVVLSESDNLNVSPAAIAHITYKVNNIAQDNEHPSVNTALALPIIDIISKSITAYSQPIYGWSALSYLIASITLFITLFAVAPTLTINSMSIMALSIYIT